VPRKQTEARASTGNKSLPGYGSGARLGANMASFILAPDVEEDLTAKVEE